MPIATAAFITTVNSENSPQGNITVATAAALTATIRSAQLLSLFRFVDMKK